MDKLLCLVPVIVFGLAAYALRNFGNNLPWDDIGDGNAGP